MFPSLCPVDQAGSEVPQLVQTPLEVRTSVQSWKRFHHLLLGHNKLKQSDPAFRLSVSGQVYLPLFVYF